MPEQTIKKDIIRDLRSLVGGDNITIDDTDPAELVLSTPDAVRSVVAGTNITVDNTDPENPIITGSDPGSTGIQSVVGGDNITVDITDPDNPIISTPDALRSVVAGTNVTIDITDPENPIISSTDTDTGIQSVVAGDNITVDITDPDNPVLSTPDAVRSVVAGTNITIDNTDPENPIITGAEAGSTGIQSVVAGSNVAIDDADPDNPIINASAGGGIELVLDTTGDGTSDTFTLDKTCNNLIVFIDGIFQRGFTQPDGTDQLVLSFIPLASENIVAYEIVKSTSSNAIATPSLTVEGSPTDVGPFPILTGSTFLFFGSTQNHLSTDWELYEGETLLWSSIDDTVNLTSITVPNGYLSENTEYIFRVRYKGDSGVYSDYTQVIARTSANFVYGWVATIGGDNYSEILNGISIDSNDNIYGVGYDQSTNSNNVEALITKWDASANLIWQKGLAGSGNESFQGITIDSSDNIYAVGRESSSTGIIAGLFTKWDVDGNLIWKKILKDLDIIIFQKISINSNNELFIVGIKYISGLRKGFISKWDIGGNLIWEKCINYDHTVQDVSFDQSNNIYIVGGTNSSFFIKLDTNGDIVWQRSIGKEYFSMIFDSNENIYVAGKGIWTSGPGTPAMITKWDTLGNLIWQREIGTSVGTGTAFHGISLDSSENIYLCGIDDSVSDTSAFIVKISPSGNLLWQRKISGPGDNNSFGIAIDSNDNIFVGGYEGSSAIGKKVLLAKFNTEGAIVVGVLANHPSLSLQIPTFLFKTTVHSVTDPNRSLITTTSTIDADANALTIINPTFVPTKSEY